MVKEEKDKGIYIPDATEAYVASRDEMYEIFKIGTENRSVGFTNMNAKSSRSHSLFIVTIFQRNNKTESTKAGKLYFVDLAGSEKLSKTGAEGQCLEEAKNINKSLMVLGMVINALTENKTHIPYRDSKLTRMLQESIGGNSQTTLIITCSMSAFNCQESLSTLRFGYRAKSIKNKVVANAERSAKELLIRLNEAEEKIKYFQNIISQFNKGGVDVLLNQVNNTSIVTTSTTQSNQRSDKCEDCSNAMRKLLNQHIELVNVQEDLEKAKLDKAELEAEIEARNQEMYEMNEKVLLCELKAKLFIEDELKTFGELQLRLEHIFLLNQQKLIQTSNIKHLIDRSKFELQLLIKSYKIKAEKEENLGKLQAQIRNLDDSLIFLCKLEQYILCDNENFNDLVEFISGKNKESENQDEATETYVNNINLNINKNININIIKDRR